MYKLFVFSIAFVLFLLEIALSVFFGKSLDSDILILACIMILPGLFTLIERDKREYLSLKKGRISEKILARKKLFYFLEKLSFYTMVSASIGTLYLGLFYLIGNGEMLMLTGYAIVLSLILSAVSTLAESVCANS